MTYAAALQPHLPVIAARAAAHDETAGFPAADAELLHELGLIQAPLPRSWGGAGLGTEPGDGRDILDVLRLLGRASLSLGRLFEAHVNVARLVVRYGGTQQLEYLAQRASFGALFGLWVTDAPHRPLCLQDGVLSGAKGPGSGAGHLRDALVTVGHDGSTRMALIEMTGDEPVMPLGTRLLGMHASTNGTVTLDGKALSPAALFGADGDYLREPDLSTGAWRGMAVALGGLDALLDIVRTTLLSRRHDQAPLQQERFGQLLLARETASLWTIEAARKAETGTDPVTDQVAYVNLARIAVESASFDVMRHAQRALGLGALVRPHPLERLLRDLTTYLRQPAPDDVLLEAARHGLAQ